MNIQSWIILILVIAAFVAVLSYIVRGGGRKDCCDGCGGGDCRCCNR